MIIKRLKHILYISLLFELMHMIQQVVGRHFLVLVAREEHLENHRSIKSHRFKLENERERERCLSVSSLISRRRVCRTVKSFLFYPFNSFTFLGRYCYCLRHRLTEYVAEDHIIKKQNYITIILINVLLLKCKVSDTLLPLQRAR